MKYSFTWDRIVDSVYGVIPADLVGSPTMLDNAEQPVNLGALVAHALQRMYDQMPKKITELTESGIPLTFGANGTERTQDLTCPSCGGQVVMWMVPDDTEEPPTDIWNAICPGCHKLVVMMLYHEPTRDDLCAPLGVADPPPPPDYCLESEDDT